jgi:excisionase family DNA binding protein
MDAARKQIEDAPTTTSDPWLTVPQAARLIGVANATVRSLAARGEFAETHVAAGRLHIHRDSIDAYLGRRNLAVAK